MTREKNRERREGDIRDREDREKYNFCLKGHALQKLVFLPVLPVLGVLSYHSSSQDFFVMTREIILTFFRLLTYLTSITSLV